MKNACEGCETTRYLITLAEFFFGGGGQTDDDFVRSSCFSSRF